MWLCDAVKSYCPLTWRLKGLKPSIVSSIIEVLNLNCKFLAVNGSEKWYSTSQLMLYFVLFRIFIGIIRVKIIWAYLEPTEKWNNWYSFIGKLRIFYQKIVYVYAQPHINRTFSYFVNSYIFYIFSVFFCYIFQVILFKLHYFLAVVMEIFEIPIFLIYFMLYHHSLVHHF